MARLVLLSNCDNDLNVNVMRPQGRRLLIVGCLVPAGGLLDVCARLECSKLEARQLIERSPDYVLYRSKRWLSLVEVEAKSERDARRGSQKPEEALSLAERRRLEELAKLELTDTPISGLLEGPPPGVSDEEYVKLLDKMVNPPKPAPIGDPTPPKPQAPVRNAVVERLTEQMRQMKANDPEYRFELMEKAAATGQAVDDSVDVSKADTGSSGDLDPGARAQLADTIPSTRWDRERLLEYARSRGLQVPDDAAKNFILRKIRTG